MNSGKGLGKIFAALFAAFGMIVPAVLLVYVIVVAYLGARRAYLASNQQTGTPAAPAEWQKSVARDYFESICIAVIFALFVRTYVVQAFKIPSSSMENNLLVGDHILVNKFAYGQRASWLESVLPYREVQHEDVVVFKYPKDARRDFIKRVIGLGGETIELRNGRVIRDDVPLEQPYVTVKLPADRGGDEAARRIHERENRKPRDIDPGYLFVMGDNRLNSEDSRFWGTVPPDYVKGKALLIYWSFDVPDHLRAVEANSNSTPREKATNLWYTFWNFLKGTRWKRTFKVIR